MDRTISGRSAAVAIGFLILGGALDVFRVIPDEVRATLAYPFLVGGMFAALWDITTTCGPPRLPTVLGAVLLVVGSVVVGYRPVADATDTPAWAIVVYAVVGAALIGLGTFCAYRFLGRRVQETTSLEDPLCARPLANQSNPTPEAQRNPMA
jgi:hypothetical protein